MIRIGDAAVAPERSVALDCAGKCGGPVAI